MLLNNPFRMNFTYKVGGAEKRTNQAYNEDFIFTLEETADRIYGTLRARKALTMKDLSITRELWFG